MAGGKMQVRSFNLGNLTELVDQTAQDLITKGIHPNYLKIRNIFKIDAVQNHRDFADKYGADGGKFQKIYLRG